jgi:hypothetical protein
MLKHSVKLRRYLLCGSVTACHGMACVLHAVQNFNVNFNEFLKYKSAFVGEKTLHISKCTAQQ